STKSGPGKCSRSFAIFGFLNPNKDSALEPSSCSMLLVLAVAMMSISPDGKCRNSNLLAAAGGQHTPRRRIHQPKALAVHRLDQLRRQLLRLIRAFQHSFQRRSLV